MFAVISSPRKMRMQYIAQRSFSYYKVIRESDFIIIYGFLYSTSVKSNSKSLYYM